VTFSNTLVETSKSYTKIVTSVDSTTDLFNAFGGVSSSLKHVAIGPFYISQANSLYCSESLLDFYGGTYEDLFNPPIIPYRIKAFAYNSYLVSGVSAMSELHLTMSNFWVGDAVLNMRLDGTLFPAFIRVTGMMSVWELRNV
jgi:hypothetical protein